MWPKLSKTVALFLGLCVFRILNTFLVQSFFDPDEYWQTLEPAYCEVFLKQQNSGSLNLDCAGYTWEWKRRADPSAASWLEQSFQGPIRSYLSVLPTHIFYVVLRNFRLDSHFWVSQGPKLLTAVLAAAPSDLAVWMMAHWWPTEKQQSTKFRSPLNLPWFCLFCSMLSWFHGYSLVRTFSNSLETMLLTVSMTLIAPELIGGVQAASAKTVRHSLCFLLGGFSVAMRFSSVTAWVPMGILLAFHQRPFSIMTATTFLIQICAVFGIAGNFVACAVDRYFSGFWTIPFLGSFHFNVLLSNSALYGSHPWYWYLTAGIPAITGLWFPFVLWDLKMLLSIENNSYIYARRNVWAVMLIYTLAHSVSGHKEFRFLMPILPLFCLQAGIHLQSFLLRVSKKHQNNGKAHATLICLWMTLMTIPNLIALLYLGLFHQSAPISVNHRIANLVAESTRSSDAGTYSIHYLTGACHSTPLHSYLHVPGPIHFDTWSLDCSPKCRSDPNMECESESFAQNPIGFVQEAYYFANPICSEEEDESVCSSAEGRQPPSFLVTYSDYAMQLRPQISDLGMQEAGRFSHGINGLRIGDFVKSGDGYVGHGMSDEELALVYRRISLLGGFLELSIDEMVLFAA